MAKYDPLEFLIPKNQQENQDRRWFPSILIGGTPQKMMQIKILKTDLWKRVSRDGFFWTSPFFRLFLFSCFKKMGSPCGVRPASIPATLEAMNDFARKRQDRQGFSFRSKWVDFIQFQLVPTCFFRQKIPKIQRGLG